MQPYEKPYPSRISRRNSLEVEDHRSSEAASTAKLAEEMMESQETDCLEPPR